MKKILVQGLLITLMFFTTWFLLKQINWMSTFKVQEVTDQTEEKLGDLFWNIFNKTETENNNKFIIKTVDSLVNKICLENDIDRKLIKFHILNNEEINAFALPNGHLVIYSGLINATDNPDELSGVICHEIAHITHNHVMKKLVKEVGLSVLISMTTGNGSAETIKETAKMLSSSAFDRKLEKEADIIAVDYLVNAKINPEPFADFLYKLSNKEHEVMKHFSWVGTHPDTKERAEYIIEYSSDKLKIFKPVLTNETWFHLKDLLKD